MSKDRDIQLWNDCFDKVLLDNGLMFFETENDFFCFPPSLPSPTLERMSEMYGANIKENIGDQITHLSRHHDKRILFKRIIDLELSMRKAGELDEPDIRMDAYNIAMNKLMMVVMQPWEKEWSGLAITEYSGVSKESLNDIQQGRLEAAVKMAQKASSAFNVK